MSRCTRSGNILDVADPEKMLVPLSPTRFRLPDKKLQLRLQSGVPEGLSWQRMFLILTNLLMMTCCVSTRRSNPPNVVSASQRPAIFYFQCLPQLHRASCGASNGHGFYLFIIWVRGHCVKPWSDPNRPLIISWVNQPYVTLGVSMFDVHSSGYGRSKSTDYESHRRTTLDSQFLPLSEILSPLLIDLRNVG